MKNLPIRIFIIAVIFSIPIIFFIHSQNISNINNMKYKELNLPEYKVTAKITDYSENILKAKVIFKTDKFNINDEIIIPNYRNEYPEEIVMRNKEIIIYYDEFEDNMIIPENISILEKQL